MISVIIPTCDRNDLLSKCLDLLSSTAQNIDRALYEVIVTDDSTQNLAKFLIEENYPWAKWIEGPKRGPAANRNKGVAFANGEWVMFIDDDCEPQKDWLTSYVEVIENTDFLVLEGKTIADRPKQRFDEEAPINTQGNKLWSCNFAIKKEFFITMQGFDESFPYPAMEDVDFYTRIVKHTNIVFVPDALVIHPWRRIKPFKSFKKHLKSHIHYAKKYQLKSKLKFRWVRVKIFIGSILFSFRELVSFSMKGWPLYIEKCVLNFCLIFI